MTEPTAVATGGSANVPTVGARRMRTAAYSLLTAGSLTAVAGANATWRRTVGELGQELTRTGADDPLARQGIAGIFRHYWRQILIGVALVSATNTAGYALTSYMPTYREKEVGVSNLMAALATVPVLVVMSACLPLIGRLSDRIGRRPVYGIAVGSTILLMVPAFAVMQIGEEWAVMIALAMVAIPVAFYVAISASALPALFPTASRFGAMAIAYNLAVSLFGGTTPLFSQALIELTGNVYMPAFYIMFFSVLAFVAVLFMKESAHRPLLGSFPTVATHEEAIELVRTQDDNPDLDPDTMPIPVVSPA